MLFHPDCIPCIFDMSVSLARKLSLNETLVRELTADFSKIPALNGQQWNITPPEVIEQVLQKIMDATGNPDPFGSDKLDINTAMLNRYNYFLDLLDQSVDPLLTAVNLSIFSNAIDVMVPKGAKILNEFDDPLYSAVKHVIFGNANDILETWKTTELKKNLLKELTHPQPLKNFTAFKEKLGQSKFLLYIGDNAGEIVLDKLLIETLKKRYELEVTFVVRSVPVLNDVTLKDAMDVGINDVAQVIENGINNPLPGTIVSRCSDELKAYFLQSDIIISKGSANFDCLSERKEYANKLVFMFLSKCLPYTRHFDLPPFQPILSCTFK